MKSTLRRGSYSALNLYFQTNLTSPSTIPGKTPNILLGSCTLPTTVTYVPDFCHSPPCSQIPFPASVYSFDGCSILASTLPGGSFRGYNKGGTAVHEIGHWFGLLHTFQGENCSFGNSGDYIDDTPLEAASTSGCPVGKDSCPLEPGVDPIHNYMDYSSDAWWVRLRYFLLFLYPLNRTPCNEFTTFCFADEWVPDSMLVIPSLHQIKSFAWLTFIRRWGMGYNKSFCLCQASFLTCVAWKYLCIPKNCL